MKALPLAGRRVVVTRPRGSAVAIGRRLAALGADVVNLPLLAIAPPLRYAALDAELRSLASYDWVVFTSRHAVDAAIARLRALGRGPVAWHGLRVAAVGPGTAAALLRHGVRPDLAARPSNAAGLVGGLLGAMRGPAAILHPTSDRARPELALGLRRAGHLVSEVVAYRTLSARPAASALRRARRADAFVVCSPSAAEELHRHRLPPAHAALACIGATSARAARRLSLRVDAVGARPTPEALAQAVARAVRRKAA